MSLLVPRARGMVTVISCATLDVLSFRLLLKAPPLSLGAPSPTASWMAGVTPSMRPELSVNGPMVLLDRSSVCCAVCNYWVSFAQHERSVAIPGTGHETKYKPTMCFNDFFLQYRTVPRSMKTKFKLWDSATHRHSLGQYCTYL